MTASDADLLASVFDVTSTAIAAVRPEQAHLPTPCTEFDVAQLIDHVTGWSRSFAQRFAGGPADDDPSGFRAGPDPAAEFSEAAQAIVSAYRDSTEQAQQLPVGFMLMEFLTHGWDLTTATRQEVTFDDAAAELALTTGRQMLKPEFRGQGKTFGHEVEVPSSAGAVDRLVAFMGRDPQWQPPAA